MIIMRVALPLAFALLVGVWLYSVFVPPPPKICGTPGGPPVLGPRITLRDGRHLAYEEYGVPKDMAKFKIIFVHGHSKNKWDYFFSTPGLFEEFQAYLVGFDRPGYGESDPDPKRTIKNTVLDIEELGDQLGLGPKFYIIGYSGGGAITWGCLKYIPHRLEGAILIAPAINFWWPSLPKDLVKEAFEKQVPWEQWNLLIAHYAPWLSYWWQTQNTRALFPPTKLTASESLNGLSNSILDQDIMKEYTKQQGVYESLIRDYMVGFGELEFEPLQLENPFPGINGAVQLWQGGADETVSVDLQRYMVDRLPWIQYHEVPNVGHKLDLEDSVTYQIFMSLVNNKTVTNKLSLSNA